jgi:hypothetical protein
MYDMLGEVILVSHDLHYHFNKGLICS